MFSGRLWRTSPRLLPVRFPPSAQHSQRHQQLSSFSVQQQSNTFDHFTCFGSQQQQHTDETRGRATGEQHEYNFENCLNVASLSSGVVASRALQRVLTDDGREECSGHGLRRAASRLAFNQSAIAPLNVFENPPATTSATSRVSFYLGDEESAPTSPSSSDSSGESVSVGTQTADLPLSSSLEDDTAEFDGLMRRHYYATGVEYLHDEMYTEALQQFRRAAELGHVPARYNVGMCYYRGYGTPVNEAEAYKHFTAAAESGHALALYQTGAMDIRSREDEQRSRAGMEKIRKAAELGLAAATKYLKNATGIGEK